MKLSQTIVLLWVARNLEWLLFISKKMNFGIVLLSNMRLLIIQKDNFKELTFATTIFTAFYLTRV